MLDPQRTGTINVAAILSNRAEVQVRVVIVTRRGRPADRAAAAAAAAAADDDDDDDDDDADADADADVADDHDGHLDVRFQAKFPDLLTHFEAVDVDHSMTITWEELTYFAKGGGLDQWLELMFAPIVGLDSLKDQ
jgi:hypothetical protein